MYPVGDLLPRGELDPGVYFVTGPSIVNRPSVVLDLLAAGDRADPGILVSTNESHARIERLVERRGYAGLGERLRLVTCDGKAQEGGEVVRHCLGVSSPQDLTGIGMRVSDSLHRIEGDGGVRVGFHSLSTLLMYSEFKTVFRFLHTLSGRVKHGDGIGFFSIDAATHEDRAVASLMQLADGRIELREGDDGAEVRVRDARGTTDWAPFDPPG